LNIVNKDRINHPSQFATSVLSINLSLSTQYFEVASSSFHRETTTPLTCIAIRLRRVKPPLACGGVDFSPSLPSLPSRTACFFFLGIFSMCSPVSYFPIFKRAADQGRETAVRWGTGKARNVSAGQSFKSLWQNGGKGLNGANWLLRISSTRGKIFRSR